MNNIIKVYIVDKTVMVLYNQMSKMKLNPIDYFVIPNNEADNVNKLLEKCSRSALKFLLIAQQKEGDVFRNSEVSNYRFDGEAMTRPEKAQMVNELKAQIPKDDADLSHKPVIDFMSYIRSMTIN